MAPADRRVGSDADSQGEALESESHSSGLLLRTQSLLLAAYYNYHGPSFWYTAITGSGPGWGDKDTYLIALQALREPFEMIPEGPHSLEASNTSEDVLTVQFSPNVPSAERLPFFVHSCGGIKWGLDEFIYAFSAARIVVWAKSLFNHRYRLLHDLLHSGHRILRREARWPDLDPEFNFVDGVRGHGMCKRRHVVRVDAGADPLDLWDLELPRGPWLLSRRHALQISRMLSGQR